MAGSPSLLPKGLKNTVFSKKLFEVQTKMPEIQTSTNNSLSNASF